VWVRFPSPAPLFVGVCRLRILLHGDRSGIRHGAKKPFTKSLRLLGLLHFRRPVLIVQSNEFNESAIRTSICAAMTSNMRLADAPGNVRVTRRASGLSRESVVNVSQLITLDKQRLTEKVGRLPAGSLRDVEAGIRLVLAL
jgi:mRNA interferase MazF